MTGTKSKRTISVEDYWRIDSLRAAKMRGLGGKLPAVEPRYPPGVIDSLPDEFWGDKRDIPGKTLKVLLRCNPIGSGSYTA